jgi:hypothetical protein
MLKQVVHAVIIVLYKVYKQLLLCGVFLTPY